MTNPWDILLSVAWMPEVRRAQYGFHPDRRGGAQVLNPTGVSWPESQFTNCCTFVAVALTMACYWLGIPRKVEWSDWSEFMLQDDVGGEGPVAVAKRWGVGEYVHPSEFCEGDWLVIQMWWSGGGGHSVFARVVPMPEGDDVGLLFLESYGQPKGGAKLGLNGVGSRHRKERKNAREWPSPSALIEEEDLHQPETWEDVASRVQTLHVARLIPSSRLRL